MSSTSPNDFPARLREIIGTSEAAYLTTHTANGEMMSRPMLILKIDESPSIWLLVSRQSDRYHPVLPYHTVSLQVIPDRLGHFVTIAGMAVRTNGAHFAESCWRESFRTWFPQGPDDPDSVVLGVLVTHADLWTGTVHQRLSR